MTTQALDGSAAGVAGPMELDVADAAEWQDLAASVGRRREQHALAFAPAFPAWFVLRHADVARAFGDERLASGYSGFMSGAVERLLGGLLANQEREKHARLRRLIAHALTPRQIERARAPVRAHVRALLAAFEPGTTVDFQRTVADELTRHATCAVLGIPPAEAEPFARRMNVMLSGATPFAPPDAQAAAEAAARELLAYVSDLAERRRREPEDALLDALLAAEDEGDRLTGSDLEQVVMSLLFGGTDTVRSFSGIATWLALAQEGTLAWLREEPARIPGTVEEMLRFESPVASVPRFAVEPIEIGGVAIAPGTRVFLDIVSANRDPRCFPDPDRFNPSRDASRHLSFGRGVHFCVGAALTRMLGQELLAALAASPRPLALAEAPRWVPFAPARRLASLSVRVG